MHDIIKNKKGNTIEIKISWCVDDVLQCAKMNKIKLTRKQAGQVLDYEYHKHDANVGVNWETLLYWIEHVKNEQE